MECIKKHIEFKKRIMPCNAAPNDNEGVIAAIYSTNNRTNFQLLQNFK